MIRRGGRPLTGSELRRSQHRRPLSNQNTYTLTNQNTYTLSATSQQLPSSPLSTRAMALGPTARAGKLASSLRDPHENRRTAVFQAPGNALADVIRTTSSPHPATRQGQLRRW